MTQQISIQEVIARMRAGTDGPDFMLSFVATSGKDKGKLKKRRCRYGAPLQIQHTRRAQAEANEAIYRDHVDRGTLPMTDLDAPRPRYITPLIATMVGYNQYRIRH